MAAWLWACLVPRCRDYREPPSKFRVAAKRENPTTHARRCTPQHRQLNCSQKCSKSQSYILAANTKPSTSCVEMGWSSQECCCFRCFIQPYQPKPRHRCIVKTRVAFEIKHYVIGKQARHATKPLNQLTSRGSKNESTSVEKLDSCTFGMNKRRNNLHSLPFTTMAAFQEHDNQHGTDAEAQCGPSCSEIECLCTDARKFPSICTNTKTNITPQRDKKGPQDSSVKTERADVADEIKTGVVTVV